MTPKEKAEDLIEKFWNDAESSIDRSMSARSCAKICVQEIIAGIESVIGYQKHFWKEGEKEMHEYYHKVLKAIDTI